MMTNNLEFPSPAARRVQRDSTRICAPDGATVVFYRGAQPFLWAATEGNQNLIR